MLEDQEISAFDTRFNKSIEDTDPGKFKPSSIDDRTLTQMDGA